jgi:ferritin-like metal-binding protein YciE
MADDEHRLDRYLNEALAMERALISTLRAHLAMTPQGAYKRLLQRHLTETRAHASALSTHAHDDSGLIETTIGIAESAVGQILSLAKGPLDLIRGGTDTRERLLKNAKDECATEALEIATYDAIEALATALGATDIALLAASHRADEERMLDELRALIPTLAAQAPPQRPGPAIADYDDLNAGQIVARLSDLSQRDLARTLTYEREHRNRRSVVERANALTGSEPWRGYDDEDAATILRRIDASTAGAVRDYESLHRRRVAILEAAQAQLSET